MPNLINNLINQELSFETRDRLSTISVEKLLGYERNNKIQREPQHFFIPSYQRGYRWETDQIKDLIKDIKEFVNDSKSGNVYWLQPIILKPKEWAVKTEDGIKTVKGWEVIDGQQRLTSLFIMINYFLKNEDHERLGYSFIPYDLYYQTRPELDFKNIESFNKSNSIEEYYIKNAWDTIAEFEFMPVINSEFYNRMKSTLMDPERMSDSKFLAFITYIFDESKDDDSTIDKFNTINGGKIKLTCAELIKALFILYIQDNIDDAEISEYKKIKFSQEWDTIETELENEDFWNFIANKTYTPDTRMNIIFDFVALRFPDKYKNDPERAYKIMQDLCTDQKDADGIQYKIPEDMMNYQSKDDTVFSFSTVWEYAKGIFQMFRFWYEDRTLYHLIGYLIAIGVEIDEIYQKTVKLNKSEVEKKLQEMIRDNLFYEKPGADSKIKKYNIVNFSDMLENLNYTEHPNSIRRVLLLFNILQYTKKTNNRFSFRFYKEEGWDIEHINPQTDNNISTLSDQYIWLSNIQLDDIGDEKLFAEVTAMKEKVHEQLNTKGNKKGENFSDLYYRICNIREDHSEKDDYKDGIANLTLLNSSINRAYQNSIFPTKRRFVIQADMLGTFIPIETKNVFLKYYSKDDASNGQWKFCWNKSDRDYYFEKMINDISPLFNEKGDE